MSFDATSGQARHSVEGALEHANYCEGDDYQHPTEKDSQSESVAKKGNSKTNSAVAGLTFGTLVDTLMRDGTQVGWGSKRCTGRERGIEQKVREMEDSTLCPKPRIDRNHFHIRLYNVVVPTERPVAEHAGDWQHGCHVFFRVITLLPSVGNYEPSQPGSELDAGMTALRPWLGSTKEQAVDVGT